MKWNYNKAVNDIILYWEKYTCRVGIGSNPIGTYDPYGLKYI